MSANSFNAYHIFALTRATSLHCWGTISWQIGKEKEDFFRYPQAVNMGYLPIKKVVCTSSTAFVIISKLFKKLTSDTFDTMV